MIGIFANGLREQLHLSFQFVKMRGFNFSAEF